MAQNTVALYDKGQDAGKQAQYADVEKLAQHKAEELESVRRDLENLRAQIQVSRNKQQEAVNSLEEHEKVNAGTRWQINQALTALRCCAAGVMAQQHYDARRYDAAIQAALEQLKRMPELLPAYKVLLLSLKELSGQPADFLPNTFATLSSLLQNWTADGILSQLPPDNQKYLSRILYDYSVYFEQVRDFEQALFAVEHALIVAHFVKGNEENCGRLEKRRQYLMEKGKLSYAPASNQ
jgi:hypothetical protein